MNKAFNNLYRIQKKQPLTDNRVTGFWQGNQM